MALSPDEIHEAATELWQDGEKVSTVNVYRNLGRRSLTTIGKHLKDWKAPEGDGTGDAPDAIPGDIEEAFRRFSVQLWEKVAATTERRISSVRRESEEEISRLRAEGAEAAELVDQLQETLEKERKEWAKERERWEKERDAFQDEVRHVREEFSVTVKLHAEATERLLQLDEELTKERERRSRAEEERGVYRERAESFESRVKKAEEEREMMAAEAALRAQECHEARAERKAAIAEVEKMKGAIKGMETLLRETQEKAAAEARVAARLEGELAGLRPLLVAQATGKPKYTRR